MAWSKPISAAVYISESLYPPARDHGCHPIDGRSEFDHRLRPLHHSRHGSRLDDVRRSHNAGTTRSFALDASHVLVLFGVFAGIALLMAIAGIYGVISYAVTQRTREIGIRVALGAKPQQVLGQVLLQGMTLAAIGVTLGLCGAIRGDSTTSITARRRESSTIRGHSRPCQSCWRWQALAANLIPARRAARVDPMNALRFE